MNNIFDNIPSADRLFTLDITPLAWVLLGAAIVAALIITAILLPRLRRVTRAVKYDTADAMSESGDTPLPYPPVSVIVTTADDGQVLARLLEVILHQDYPAPFEVIVVDMDANDDTKDLIASLQREHSNLYLTFTPQTARNLSRKKLAITLGVKAAANDAMLITAGNCSIASDKWMRCMARHFAQGKKVVIGYSHLEPGENAKRSRAKRRRAYDMGRTAFRMFAAALGGRPLRADGNNMGLSRELFLSHKGFSRHFDLIYGDDDVFVREITNRKNTGVELAQQSFVTSWRHDVASEHRRELMHRNFNSRFLRRWPRWMWKTASWLWWVWAAASAACIAVSVPSLIPLCAVTGFNILFSLAVGISWRRASKALGLKPLMFTVPWLSLAHPLYVFGAHLHNDGVATNHYIWQQELSPKA